MEADRSDPWHTVPMMVEPIEGTYPGAVLRYKDDGGREVVMTDIAWKHRVEDGVPCTLVSGLVDGERRYVKFVGTKLAGFSITTGET